MDGSLPGVPLLPKLRGYFAEFLHHDSLDRLGILYQSTCVGLGYGRLTTRSRSFSRQHRITHFLTIVTPSDLGLCVRRICLSHSLHPWTWTTIATRRLPSCVSPSLTYYQIGSHAPQPAPTEVSYRRFGCLASKDSIWAVLRRYGNINPLSIDYACRPRLRSRLTQGRLA